MKRTTVHPTDLHFRGPRPADYESLTRWIVDREACLRWAGPRVRFPFTAEGLQAQMQVPGGATCVLVQADAPASRMLGLGQFWPGSGGAVHLGRLLCQSLMQQATLSTGAQAATLRVYRDNSMAVALYTHRGFVPVAAESSDAVLFMRAVASGGFE